MTYEVIKEKGCCGNCGNRRYSEITLLRQEEMDKILSGEINFEGREQFLSEFSATA